MAGREIWNSEQGFVGTYFDYQALMHCLSCQRRDGCPVVDACGLANQWQHYAKDESSPYASEVD